MLGESDAEYRIESSLGGLWNVARFEGTSVLVPGRTDQVMVIGGRSPLTATCKIIDFADPEPFPRSTGFLNHARAHAEAVILPDKTVLVMGGGTTELYENPINIPEIYDPDTETWREVAPHVYGRMYRNAAETAYSGRCPSCGAHVHALIGPDGTSRRTFEAS